MANIPVENKEYMKTYELFKKLNNYINPNNEYTDNTKLLDAIMNSTEEGTFYDTDNDKLFKDSGTFDYNIDKTFVNLIKQAIKCKIYNIKYDVADITEDTKGLFKFITQRVDSANGAAQTGTAILDHEKVKNILASLDVINTVIDVYDAYADFIKNNPEIYATENFDNIIIVNDTDKQTDNSVSDDGNSGYYIKLDADYESFNANTDGAANRRINRNTLFLAIKSFDTDFLTEYHKYHNLTEDTESDADIGVGSKGTAEIAPSDLSSSNTDLFNAAGTLNSGGSSKIFIKGIYFKNNSSNDYDLVDQPDAGAYTVFKNADYKTISVGNYKLRNQVIFKEFINYMCKLNKKDKYGGVYAILNLLRMCKVYINLAITNCNVMFNRVFVKHVSASPDLDYAQSTAYAADGSTHSHEGFVLKHINNDDIKAICNLAGNDIYGSAHTAAQQSNKEYFVTTGTLGGIDSIQYTLSPGGTTEYTTTNTEMEGRTEMLDKSYYGAALKENKTFYDEIIKILNKLKYELSESISILYDDIDITSASQNGFEARVIDHNTIRIKRRNELVNTICDPISNSECTDPKIGTVDFSAKPITDQDGFNIDKIISELASYPDIQEAFINGNEKIISRSYQIKINNKPYEILKINKTSSGHLEFDIRARLSYSYYDDYHNKNIDKVDAPILATHSNVKLFKSTTDSSGVISYAAISANKFSDYDAAKNTGHILFHNHGTNNKVTLSKKDAYDYNNTYIENIIEIRKSNSNINTNESKIKNYETIYNTYKSRYDFMHNQFMAYSTIIVILAVALLVGSVSSNNLATTKLITLICFGIIIFIFVTYYVFNILYVNEHFTNKKKVEKFEVGTYRLVDIAPFPAVIAGNHLEFKLTDQSNNFMYKKDNFVQNQLDSINNRIIQNFELLNVGIRQNDSNYAFGNLMNISTNERVSRNKINTILDNKKVNTTTHIDLLKYEIAVYRVKINTLLYSALVIIGLITINLYTEGQYYGNLVFIGTLFGIIILTYYLIYSNHIVRTESKNFYWGKEFEASFE